MSTTLTLYFSDRPKWRMPIEYPDGRKAMRFALQLCSAMAIIGVRIEKGGQFHDFISASAVHHNDRIRESQQRARKIEGKWP